MKMSEIYEKIAANPDKVICTQCGHTLEIGDHPFCPHGASRGTIARDEIPGGIIVENYGPHPIRFDSHSERRAYMKAHGLSEREKFSPKPGTDIDPAGIPNPKGYVDDYTRRAGEALILRQQGSGCQPPVEGEVDPVASGELIPFNETRTLPKSKKKRERKYGVDW